MYEGSNALTYVQGDVWSGGGFNISLLDLGDAFENGALMFWMWSEPDASELRLQFEDGVGKVGTNFTPDPSGGWHQYGFYLDEFVFVDGSTDFNPNAVTVFQVMAEEMVWQEELFILMKCIYLKRKMKGSIFLSNF